MTQISLSWTILFVFCCSGAALRLPVEPYQEGMTQSEIMCNEMHYWGGCDNIFIPEEELILKRLESESSRTYNLEKQYQTPSMVFVWHEHWGTAIVRADEASEILLQHGTQAISMKCESFCAIAKDQSPADVIIHVKKECECARKLGNLHVYDPIDHDILSDRGKLKKLASKYYFLTGTSKMETAINNIKAGAAMVLPHHHSNFHKRVHVEKRRNEPLTIVMSGHDEQVKLAGHLKECLQTKLGHNITLVNPMVKGLQEVKCDTGNLQGPSVRGDCFAEKLAQFDIALIWKQNEKEPYLDIKPYQRLANALAVGIPVVAYSKYAGHQEVNAMAPKAVRLASTDIEVCEVVTELVLNHGMRGEAGLQALKVAENFSPDTIGKRYLSIFEYFKEKQAQQQSS